MRCLLSPPRIGGVRTDGILRRGVAVSLQRRCNGARHHRGITATGGGADMRARYPDVDGFVEHDGLKLYYEIHGEAHAPTVVLMSNAPLTLRHWKAQIAFLARHFRVVVFDGPGGGRADRPVTPAAYTDAKEMDYTRAILDGTNTERAVLVAYSDPGVTALQLAITEPDRVLGVVSITPIIPYLTPGHAHRGVYDFDAELDTDEGWAKV